MNSPDKPRAEIPVDIKNTVTQLTPHLQFINQYLVQNPDLISDPAFSHFSQTIKDVYQTIDAHESKNNLDREGLEWALKISKIGSSRLMVKSSPDYDFSNHNLPTSPDSYKNSGFRYSYTGNRQLIGDGYQHGIDLVENLTRAALIYPQSELINSNLLISYPDLKNENVFIVYIAWQHPQSAGVDMRGSNSQIPNETRFVVALPNDEARQLLRRVEQQPNLIDSIFQATYPNLLSKEISPNHLTRNRVNTLNVFSKNGFTDEDNVTLNPKTEAYPPGKFREYLKPFMFSQPVGEM